MSYNSRRILTPGNSRKRKEREDQYFYYSSLKPSSTPAQAGSASPVKSDVAVASNRLLAGYMAHEFLTKGTLLGQKFDPTRPQSDPMRPDPGVCADVAGILKTSGAHIPGIVNPAQLARWIQM